MVNLTIPCQHCHSFNLRLRNEQPIKGIAVQEGQLRELPAVFGCNWLPLNLIDLHFLLKLLTPIRRQRQFAKTQLDTDFPVTGGTEVEPVARVQKRRGCRRTQPLAGDGPQECGRIEQ